MKNFDLDKSSVRELNQALHEADKNSNCDEWIIDNSKGKHAIAVGVNSKQKIIINGHVGYYCAGMNKEADVQIKGNCGAGVAENMMSGKVHVHGYASQYAGATGHGGLLVIEGDASSRCGISMKGINIVVKGSVGHMSAFMAQKGNLVICGDAGDALGDSLYEAKIFVRGKADNLGADCIEKPMQEKHYQELKTLLDEAGMNEMDALDFRRYGSARKLYNFDINDVQSY